MADGNFTFDTNIDSVLARIRQGLAAIRSSLAANQQIEGRRVSNKAAQNQRGELQQLERQANQVTRSLERMSRADLLGGAGRKAQAELAAINAELGRIQNRVQSPTAKPLFQTQVTGSSAVGAENRDRTAKQKSAQVAADVQAQALADKRARDAQAARQRRLEEAETKALRQQENAAQRAALRDRVLAEGTGRQVKGSGFVTPDGRIFGNTDDERGFRELRQSQAATQRALDGYRRVIEQEAAQMRRQNLSPLQSFVGGASSRSFGTGDGTFDGAGLAGALGNTVKYAALYSILNLTQRAFSDTINEAKDYRDSLTDLNVALGEGEVASRDYVNELSQVSRLAGGNVGQALDSAARGVRAFSRPGADQQEQETAGFETARTASRLSTITGKEIKDSTGDVIAIGKAYDVAANGQNRLLDAISAAKQQGGDPANIAQGLANGAEGLTAAGLSLEEAAQTISLVQGSTDQSGQAVATRLNRIVSIINGGAGRKLLASLDIDTNQSQRDQLVELAGKFDSLNAGQQARVRNTLGGTGNLREFLVLIDGLKESGSLFDGFTNGFETAGAGLDDFNRRSDDLVGKINKLKGSASNIQVKVFDAGVLAPFGVILETALPAAQAIENVIEAYNKLFDLAKVGILPDFLPGVLKGSTALIVEGLAVGALVRRYRAGREGAPASAGAGAGAGAAGRSAEATAAARQSVAIDRVTRARIAEHAARGGTLTSAGRTQAARNAETLIINRETTSLVANTRARIANAGAGAAGLIGRTRSRGAAALGTGAGQAAAGFAGFVALSAIYEGFNNAAERSEVAIKGATAALESLTLAADEVGLRDAATAYSAAAEQYRDASKGFFGTVNDVDDRTGAVESIPIIGQFKQLFDKISGRESVEGGSGAEADRLDRGADLLRTRADEVERVRRESIERGDAGAFGDFSNIEALTTDLEALEEAGLGADRVTRLFLDTLKKTAEDGGGAGTIQPGRSTAVAQVIAASFGETLEQAVVDQLKVRNPQDTQQALGQKAQEILSKNLSGEEGAELNVAISRQIEREINTLIPGGTGVLTSEQIDTIARNASILYIGDLGEDSAKTRAALQGALAQQIKDQTNPLAGIATQTDLTALVTLRLPAIQNSGADVFARNQNEVQRAEQRLADMLELRAAAIAAGFNEPAELTTAIVEGQRALGEATNAAAVAQQEYASALLGADDDVAAANIALQIALANARQAMLYGTLTAFLAAMGAVKEAQRMKADADAAVVESQRLLDAVGNPGATAAAEQINRLGRLDRLTPGSAQFLDTQREIAEGGIAEAERQKSERERAAADAEAARREALEARKARRSATAGSDPLSQGRADLENARDDLRSAEKGSADYYNALGAVRDAQEGLADSHASLAGAAAKANADPASALQGAAADITAARAQLAAARRGTEDYYNALGSLRQAQVSYVDAVVEANAVTRLLSIDLTDPLARAQADLAQAREKLAASRGRGASRDVINQDLLAVREAEINAEAAAFSQRFSDAQTADELGRSSHQAYLSYLRNEHTRLSSIANRTRQQQDQLNQVDSAIKAAQQQLQGQFNLGDIRIPTPFEVRRAIGLEQARPGSTRSQGAVSNVQINVNGGDTTKVMRAVVQAVNNELGTSISATGTYSGRKS